MNDIDLEVLRLRRHYEIAKASQDLISLLDLAGSLRNFVELKNYFLHALPEFGRNTLFRTGRPSRKFSKWINKNSQFVYWYPAGFVTVGYKDEFNALGYDPHVFWLDGNIKSQVKLGEIGKREIEVSRFWMASSASDQGEPPADLPIEKACTFVEWLGAPYLVHSDLDKRGAFAVKSSTLEHLIRRVAAALGSTHPAALRETRDPLDDRLREFQTIAVAQLPLPRLMMLKAAQDILAAMQSV